MLRKLEDSILQASNEEKDFLILFGSPSPTSSNQPEHPFLTSIAYGSIHKLVGNNILREELDEKNKKTTYHLMPDVTNFIEKHITNGKVQRISITIDEKNVEGRKYIGQESGNS